MPSNTAPKTAYPITAPKPQSGRPAWLDFNPLYAISMRIKPTAIITAASSKLRRKKLPCERMTATTSEAVATTICAQIGARQAFSNPRINNTPLRVIFYEASF